METALHYNLYVIPQCMNKIQKKSLPLTAGILGNVDLGVDLDQLTDWGS